MQKKAQAESVRASGVPCSAARALMADSKRSAQCVPRMASERAGFGGWLAQWVEHQGIDLGCGRFESCSNARAVNPFSAASAVCSTAVGGQSSRMAGFRRTLRPEEECRASCRNLLQVAHALSPSVSALGDRRLGSLAARGYRFAGTGSGFLTARDSRQSSSSAPQPGCGTRRDCSPNMEKHRQLELGVTNGKEARYVRNR